MKFGKYMFKSVAQFLEIQNLAIKKGLGTDVEFSKFLNDNYSQYLVK